jgi:hypothetical protein
MYREEFMFAHLPQELQTVWADIEAVWEQDPVHVRLLLKDKSDKEKQSLFLYALSGTTFSINTALRMCGVGKRVFDRWRKDPGFMELMEQIDWHRKNFLEDKLLGLVNANNAAAIMWVNKVQNRDRGYGEVVEVVGNVSHTHTHAALDLTTLDLPPDVMDQVVAAMLKAQGVSNDGVIEGNVIK